ncbi:MAG: hypothetical protein AAB932_02000, partial [Patescibacteria group bacterium]
TVTNNGDRPMRLSSTTINVAASGLTGNNSATGTVSGSWQLWEANEIGGLGTQLAATTTCQLTGGAGVAGCSVNAATGNTLDVVFGPLNDVNSLLDDFQVPAGGSRTLIFVGDTSGIFNGKTQGSVSVSAKLDGATGFSAGNTTNETDWADGVITYFYTPVSGSANTTAYSGSDSYDVVGDTLSKSI